MTNLKAVDTGFNKFCGPAVLSILTGRNTDECARAISRINGNYNIKGVLLTDLLKAAGNLGFDTECIGTNYRSLYSALISLAGKDGIYIVTLEKHFITIEVISGQINLCDNHTKEPISAASSARLSQKVVAIHKVTPKPPKPQPILVYEGISVSRGSEYPMTIIIRRDFLYKDSADNHSQDLAKFTLKSSRELEHLIGELG